MIMLLEGSGQTPKVFRKQNEDDFASHDLKRWKLDVSGGLTRPPHNEQDLNPSHLNVQRQLSQARTSESNSTPSVTPGNKTVVTAQQGCGVPARQTSAPANMKEKSQDTSPSSSGRWQACGRVTAPKQGRRHQAQDKGQKLGAGLHIPFRNAVFTLLLA